jgi:hypothetical protein
MPRYQGWASWRVEDAELQPDSEYDRDNGEGLVSSGAECVGCGRIMSVRERNDQGVCNDCATGT